MTENVNNDLYLAKLYRWMMLLEPDEAETLEKNFKTTLHVDDLADESMGLPLCIYTYLATGYLHKVVYGAEKANQIFDSLMEGLPPEKKAYVKEAYDRLVENRFALL